MLLKEYDTRQTPALLDSLRQELDVYPDARLQVTEFENGPPIDAPIAMRVAGRDLDSLRAIGARVEHVLGRGGLTHRQSAD